ncbi:putative steroid 5 alpha-reductase [Coleophoma crateriformis]|uniref:Putative steroid 5 alpha-reductase n=1 Tax=Coleophoma crateriformis TaxID=565419 RepID=A0A3D8T0F7_9HELO|nr:putative steroid 5 alpha-reductase [Coleophoma crateriformis]
MVLVQNCMPPSRENWEFMVWIWQFFPLITIAQWIPAVNRIYQMGKTSSDSRFNIPGRIAWITMEIPGPLSLIYIMLTVPSSIGLRGLPWENKVMGAFYVLHYINRAIISPLIAPSISPIAPHIWLFAAVFQLSNGISIGGWLGGYGNTTAADWQNHEANYKAGGRMELGMMIFFLGFLANIFHDDELREIRRAAMRNQARREAEKSEDERPKTSKGADKIYMVPRNGLFEYILYPHYLCEWIEWTGYWIMAGLGCVPARNFVINEIATMLPRAVQGKQWYVQRFGEEKIAGRKAVIPGVL